MDADGFGESVGRLIRGNVGDIHVEVGGGRVQRTARSQEVVDGLAGIFGADEGPVVVAHDALKEDFLRGIEPDDEAETAEPGNIVRNGDDAAAGGDHGPVGGGQIIQHGGLKGAESGFAFLFKDEWNRPMGFFDDELIRINKLEAELAGEQISDRGFPASHEADEDDIERAWCCRGHVPMLRWNPLPHKAASGQHRRRHGHKPAGFTKRLEPEGKSWF